MILLISLLMKFKRDGKEHISIKEIKLSDGTIIGVFEGNRGANPDHKWPRKGVPGFLNRSQGGCGKNS